MQDIAAEEEQASPAQDESSGSSAFEPWEELEDPHPPEKRVRTLSPEYDHAEELPKRTQCRCKKTHRVMEETSVLAAAHSEKPEAEPTMGPLSPNRSHRRRRDV